MRYAHPGTPGAIVSFKSRYGNFIGGQFVEPVKGQYFTNTTPVTGEVIAEFPRSSAEDIDRALDAAHAAADAWGRTAVQDRSLILLKIADRIEQNLELLAVTETWDNGKPVRETLNADIPLAVDHFRYFAGCIRAQEGSAAEINEHTVAYHIHEPLGVVGQIIPWNFPLLMAAWKLAPALAAGNCIVLKPAEQTPLGINVLMELIGDLLPPGVLNVVHGFGKEADEAQALQIANDTEYGLGAGLWTRDINRAYRVGRAIKAGRVWTNCYHLYPAHAAFGGYKKSGVGRETHKMMLDHYQQTKNLLVSYDTQPLGFF
jgi:aldehyde dehydrogenase